MKWLAIPSIVFLVAMVLTGPASAVTCGSALIAEKSAPGALQGFTLGGATVARFWQSGSGGSNFATDGCASGCLQSGSNVALTGVNWLNATACASAGFLPSRTIFVMETTTVSSGGRWAAVNVDPDASGANTDLDAKATSICGGCSSVASGYLGGGGQPSVSSPSVVGDNLSATITWTAPVASAQQLSNGSSVISSYAVFYKRSTSGVAPSSSGDKTGWTVLADQEADGAALGGYSSDTSAAVTVPLGGSGEHVYFAVGLNFDGSGNPSTDTNSKPSTYLSAISAPTLACLSPDTTSPWVTAPSAITVDQTLCCGSFGGATPASNATLSDFVNGGSATDGCTASPTRLAAQVGGADVTSSTCFEAGSTTVTFRFQDASNNIGTATSSVTVRMYGDLNLDASVDPADMVVLQSFFNFAATPGVPPFAAPEYLADLTHDASVNPADMVLLQAYFNFAVACLAP